MTGASAKKRNDFSRNSSRNPIDVAHCIPCRAVILRNVPVVDCNCGDPAQASAARRQRHEDDELVRHFRCIIANTASMIGIVTIAVRETMTNTILTTKFSETAIGNSACQIFLSRSSVMMG